MNGVRLPFLNLPPYVRDGLHIGGMAQSHTSCLRFFVGILCFMHLNPLYQKREIIIAGVREGNRYNEYENY